MKILTIEWLEAFGDAINNNQAYKDAASWWEGDMLCVIEPSGPLDHEVRFYLGLYHGDCTGVKLLEPGEQVNPEFTLAGPYDNWVKVLKKEVFKKYGKQFLFILLSEAFGAFLLVFRLFLKVFTGLRVFLVSVES